VVEHADRHAYIWERCGLAGRSCVAIPGAIAQTDTLTTADVGHTLRVQEIASNSSGTGIAATSSQTAPVTSGKHYAPPNTLLLEHQVSSHDHRATFRFKATGTASRFECALVRKPTRRGARTPAPKYVSCRSPKTFTRLEAGSYVLYVRAVGPGGADRTPASYEFRIT
jgi:predicted phage tail protein